MSLVGPVAAYTHLSDGKRRVSDKQRVDKTPTPLASPDDAHLAVNGVVNGASGTHIFGDRPHHPTSGTSTQAPASCDFQLSSASWTPLAPSRRVQRKGSSLTTCLRKSSHWILKAFSKLS